MAYFPDLSPYTYGLHRPARGVLHVGWLDGVHAFPKGEVEGEVLAKLKALATTPTNCLCGVHLCELCFSHKGPKRPIDAYNGEERPPLGNGEIRVTLDKVTYAAPVLVVHYIEEHGYLPPEGFLRAVMMATPPPQRGTNPKQPISPETVPLKRDPDEVPSPPMAPIDGPVITLKCRTPAEAYLVCDELQKASVPHILPDEKELLCQFKRDGYVEVRVSAKPYESLPGLRSSVEFQYRKGKPEQ